MCIYGVVFITMGILLYKIIKKYIVHHVMHIEASDIYLGLIWHDVVQRATINGRSRTSAIF